MSDTQEFFAAVKAGDAGRVARMLEANLGLLNTREGSGESAVLLAAYYRRKDVLELLLSRGAALNIFEAAVVGKVQRVEALLAADPSLANGYAPDGFPLLGLAAFFGHREVVDLLLRHGAEVNAVSRNATGYTALTGAVAGGHAEIAAALLAAGANANHRYGAGYTPLYEAAAGGKTKIVALLLAHGADPNARTDDGQTPFLVAEAKGHADVAALLRQHQATSAVP